MRANLSDGDWISGNAQIVGSADAGAPVIEFDGQQCAAEPSLETAPVFAFEATGVDTFFQNAIMFDGEPVHIFDDSIPTGWETISSEISLEAFAPGETVTVSVAAGTKAHPGPDDLENNDDFTIRDARLVLPDGRTLTPTGYTAGTELKMGDSAGLIGVYDAEFVVPEDAFSSVRCAVDTAGLADGEHAVAVRSGDDALEFTVNVDNTAPVITTSIADGDTLRGETVLDADIVDGEGQGVDSDSITTTLDGETVQLPLETSSTELAAGEHTLVVTAADLQGNLTEETVQFTVPVENLSAEVTSFPTCDADGHISVTDPSGDDLNVSVRRGETVPVTDLEVTSGTVHDGAATDREAPL